MDTMHTPGPVDPANRDPFTKAPGAHPVGVAVGATVGGVGAGGATAAATGAAIGTAVGPVGTEVGAAIGAVVGGLAGKAVAEHHDPTVEDGSWRDNYSNQPDYDKSYSYNDYAPAYRLGGESRSKYKGHSFDSAERELSADWERAKGSSRMTWEHAKSAVRAGCERITH